MYTKDAAEVNSGHLADLPSDRRVLRTSPCGWLSVVVLPSLVWLTLAGCGTVAPENAVAPETAVAPVTAQDTDAAQAAPQTTADGQSDEPMLTVEEILKRDPQASDYVDTPRCISTNRIRGVQILDEKHVAFRMSRDEYMLVQFQHRCPGMRRGNTVIYETRTNRLCALDSLRTVSSFGDIDPGPPCPIPGFQSVSKESLAALKEALKAERNKPRTKREKSDES